MEQDGLMLMSYPVGLLEVVTSDIASMLYYGNFPVDKKFLVNIVDNGIVETWIRGSIFEIKVGSDSRDPTEFLEEDIEHGWWTV